MDQLISSKMEQPNRTVSCDDTSTDLPTAVGPTEVVCSDPPSTVSGEMDRDLQGENISVEAEAIAAEVCGNSDELGQPAVSAVPRRLTRERRAPAHLTDYHNMCSLWVEVLCTN